MYPPCPLDFDDQTVINQQIGTKMPRFSWPETKRQWDTVDVPGDLLPEVLLPLDLRTPIPETHVRAGCRHQKSRQ
jgi:hypothetical protein